MVSRKNECDRSTLDLGLSTDIVPRLFLFLIQKHRITRIIVRRARAEDATTATTTHVFRPDVDFSVVVRFLGEVVAVFRSVVVVDLSVAMLLLGEVIAVKLVDMFVSVVGVAIV
jgi:hypothetical protein